MYRKLKIDVESAYIPVVKYFLGDQEHWAIIDTGSQFSIIDKSLDGGIENGHEMNMVTLSADEGKKLRRADKCITFIDTDGKKFKCDIIGFETELKHMEDAIRPKNRDKIKIDLIIGNNDLCDYQCKLDLKNGYLMIQDKPHK